MRCNISIESQRHIEIFVPVFFPLVFRRPKHTKKKTSNFCYNLWLCVLNRTKNRLNSLCEMAEYCIVISIVLGIDVAVAVVVFFNSIVFDRTVQFIKMEYWLTVTDLNRPYCNSLHHVPRLLLLYVYAIDYVCSSFFSRPSDHFYGESSNSSSHFLYGAFFSSALLFIKFQWMVVVWHPLYRSQKIHYWVLTHKCYKSIKKSTNKWQLISLLSLVFKKNGKEMNIHLEFYWKIRAISYSWSVFCFSWIFCRSFALSICVFFFTCFWALFGIKHCANVRNSLKFIFRLRKKNGLKGLVYRNLKKNKNVKFEKNSGRKAYFVCLKVLRLNFTILSTITLVQPSASLENAIDF